MSAVTLEPASDTSAPQPAGRVTAAFHGRLLAAVAALAISSIYAALALWRYATLQAGIDLAIYTQAVQDYAQAGPPLSSVKGIQSFALLGDHFTPAVAVLAPIYKIWPHAWVLLVAQAVIIGLTVYVVVREVSRTLGPWVGTATGAVCGLAWGIQGLATYDFHEVVLALPLIAVTYSKLLRGRYLAAVLWATPLMLVKEDSVFLLLGLTLVLIAQRRLRLAAGTALYALLSFVVIVGVVIPHLSYYGRYTYWSSSAAQSGAVEMAQQAATNLARSLASGAAPLLAFVLLAPTMLVAVRSPLALGAVPPLLSRLTSPDPTYWSPWFHYNATVTVILLLAAVDGVNRLRASGSRITPSRWAAGSLLATAVLLPFGPASGVVQSSTHTCWSCVEKARQELLAIPNYANVAASGTVIAYLVDRTSPVELHDGLRDSAGVGIQPVYIAVDMRGTDADSLLREARRMRFVPVPTDDGSITPPPDRVATLVAR